MKWKTTVYTITQVLQVIRGYLISGDERITIEAKEKGRYAITTMRGDQGVSENRAAKKNHIKYSK